MIAAEAAVNLSGTWVFDPAHSQISHTSPNPRKLGITLNNGYPDNRQDDERSDAILLASPETQMQFLTLQVIQTDGAIQIVREFTLNGIKQTVSQKFLLDGSQCINVASNGEGGFLSRTIWRNRRLINSGTQTITEGVRRTEIGIEEEFAISKDGKKLTIDILNADPRGVLHFKQVYLKK